MKCYICTLEKEELYPLETYSNTRDLHVCRDCITESGSRVHYNEENQTFFMGEYIETQYGPGLLARMPSWRQAFYTLSSTGDEILDPEYNYLGYNCDTEESRYYECSVCHNNLLTRRLYYNDEEYRPVCASCNTGEPSLINPNENVHPDTEPGSGSLSDRDRYREAQEFPIRVIADTDFSVDKRSKDSVKRSIGEHTVIYDLALDSFINSTIANETYICKGDILTKTIGLTRSSLTVSSSDYNGYKVVFHGGWGGPTTREPQHLSKRENIPSQYLCQNCGDVSNKMLPVYTDDKIYLHCQKCAMDKDLVLQERTSERLYLKAETSFVKGRKGLRRVVASRTDFDSDGQLRVPKNVQEDLTLKNPIRCHGCHRIKRLTRLHTTNQEVVRQCDLCIHKGVEEGIIANINDEYYILGNGDCVFNIVTRNGTERQISKKNDERFSDDCLICKRDGHVHYATLSTRKGLCLVHYNLANPRPEAPEAEVQSYHSHSTEPRHFLHTQTEYLNNVETYFGIELETEFNRCISRNATAREALRLGRGLFYAESDGSLTNGFELISRPMTLRYLRLKKTRDAIQSMLDYLKAEGATTEKNTAGMHIHISRPTGLPIKEEYEKNLFWIVETLNLPIQKIAEREPTSYCESVIQKLSQSHHVQHLKKAYVDKNIDWSNFGRHMSLNMNGHNSKTHELRIFNTTLSCDHIIAAVELFNAMSEAAKDLDSFNKLTFGKLVRKYGGKYLKKEAQEKELQQYYKLKIPEEVRIK